MQKMYDGFGFELEPGDEVMYAGRSGNRRPTLNKGRVEQVSPDTGKVLVFRTGRSGMHNCDIDQQRVWVHAVKVGKI